MIGYTTILNVLGGPGQERFG